MLRLLRCLRWGKFENTRRSRKMPKNAQYMIAPTQASRSWTLKRLLKRWKEDGKGLMLIDFRADGDSVVNSDKGRTQ